MKTFSDKIYALFSKLEPGEGRTVTFLTLQGFFILFAYYMMKVIRDPMILSEGSAELKSYTTAIQAFSMLFIVPIFAKVYQKFGHPTKKYILVRKMFLFFILNLILFSFFYYLGFKVSVPFYVWLGIFSVMVLALFWSFAADLLDVAAGKRIFPITAAGGALGAYLGAKVTGWIDPLIGHDGVMLVSALLLIIPWALCKKTEQSIPELSKSKINTDSENKHDHILEGFLVVFRNNYLLLIALFIVLLNLINTNGEYILAKFVTMQADTLASSGNLPQGADHYITAFYSSYLAWFSLAGFLIQLFLVARIFKWIGIKGAILILPVTMLINYSIIFFIPIFALIRVSMIIENSINYSVQNTTRHALFLPVSRDEKYVGKNTIETFFHRFGDLISAGLVLISTQFIELGIIGFISMNVVLAMLFLITGWKIGQQNQSITEKTDS